MAEGESSGGGGGSALGIIIGGGIAALVAVAATYAATRSSPVSAPTPAPSPSPAPRPAPPLTGSRSWSAFVPYLAPAAAARYSLTGAKVPILPPGTSAFLPESFQAPTFTNCSVFTAYLLGNGYKIPFTRDQWLEWQVAKGLTQSLYRGYGPAVVAEWGVGQMIAPTLPKDGVYLIQSFGTWPQGHSWLVLDYDPATDKMLTLEANTSASGLDGVGFGGMGPLRAGPPVRDWRQRSNMTWRGRTAGQTIYMARLNIDHNSVRDWIATQTGSAAQPPSLAGVGSISSVPMGLHPSVAKKTTWRLVDFQRLYRGLSDADAADYYVALARPDGAVVSQVEREFYDGVDEVARERGASRQTVLREFAGRAAQAGLPSATGNPPLVEQTPAGLAALPALTRVG